MNSTRVNNLPFLNTQSPGKRSHVRVIEDIETNNPTINTNLTPNTGVNVPLPVPVTVKENKSGFKNSWVIWIILIPLIIGALLYLLKPTWVLKRTDVGIPIPGQVDWARLIIWTIVITLIIYAIIWAIKALMASS